MQTISRTRSPSSRAEQVANSIRESIAKGDVVPGQYIRSERALSETLGVSRVTVRRGLALLVEEGILSREPGRGYFVGRKAGKPRDAGEAAGAAMLFLHAHPEHELANGTDHGRMWGGAREEAARAGMLTMVSSISEQEMSSEKAEDLGRLAAGVLCDYSDKSSIQTLLKAGIPVIRIHYYPNGLGIDAIVQDDSGGIEAAVEHLYERGHRRIGYLDAAERLREAGRAGNAERRRAGYMTACVRLGLDAGPELIGEVDLFAEDDLGSTKGLLEAGVTALVVPHQELWPSVRKTLADEGVRVGKPFGVVVWGDPPRGQGDAEFPTSVTWSKEQMGREAVRRLLMRLERPQLWPATIVIPAELVDRGTGGRGPGDAE